jgi:branched-chain amino acid transport system permease protein
MLGAYFGYSITLYLGSFWLGLILSPLIVALVAIFIERFFLRGPTPKGHVPQILLTFGLLYMISKSSAWSGNQPLRLFEPRFCGDIPFMGRTYPMYRLFIISFSILILIGMLFFLLHTDRHHHQAAVHDADMVGALGINVPIYCSGFTPGGGSGGPRGDHCCPFSDHLFWHGRPDPAGLLCGHHRQGFGSLLGAFVASLMVGQLNPSECCGSLNWLWSLNFCS